MSKKYQSEPSSKFPSWNRYVTLFENIGRSTSDSEDIRTQKATLTAMTILAGSLSVIWGTMFLLLGITYVAIIAYSYSVISFLGIVFFAFNHNIDRLRNSQLLSAILLPFFATIVMGGFIPSAIVIVWSMLTPFGALLYSDYRKAHRWYFFFVILLIFGGLLGLYVDLNQELTGMWIQLFFILNFVGITAVIFYVVLYFVDSKYKAVNLLNQLIENQFSELVEILDVQGETLEQARSTSSPVFFMIIDNSGLSTFSKMFARQIKTDGHLIGGFLSAINSISQEAFGVEILKEIKYKDFSLLFEPVFNHKFVYAFKGNIRLAKDQFSAILKALSSDDFSYIYTNPSQVQDNNQKINLLLESILL